jgi:DNA topoisomerase-2
VSKVPGLYKIFDEILVNAADNKQRDKTMNKMEVCFDREAGSISVKNNGRGIPIAMHQEHNVYVPELIFGHLLTGSNFDDKKQKTTGGRNGFGAKLANIFSNEFIVETVDSEVGKKYRQVFQNNMSVKGKPSITSCKSSDYTMITFKPDLARFQMEDGLDDDIIDLFTKRVYDMAGVTAKSLKVHLNGKAIPCSGFQKYMKLFATKNAQGEEQPQLYEQPNDRWEIGLSVSDGSFQQVSFVNSIATAKGGQHVNYITDQVTAQLLKVCKKKNKGVELKATHVKNHICLFVNALIENPAFDSQTKDNLTTRPKAFGSECKLSDKFLKQIEKSGVVENILSWAKFKQNAELRRKGGAKKTKLTGITKLDDANFAGGAKGGDCTLILTEGDSAKALAISGLSVVGRDYYGVFPLKGKLLNVREAGHAQIMKNEEIQNITKILGLRHGEKYDSVKQLRYGHLMIMADQDHDGSHIKGLLINFIHHFWPSLLQIDGFMQQFITPIVKCSKGKKVETFYTVPEYDHWKEGNNEGQGWKVKYYKGLGTSTAAEAKEYFTDMDTSKIDFSYSDQACDEAIDLAFSKKQVDARKRWLTEFKPGTHIDYDVETMQYQEFVHKELVLFSVADNARSIPCVIDGFKPSQRKVLFSCFKRKLVNEIKVAQLAGYVSEHSAYHHGEMSLNGTIVNMAQNFCGSNNINLLFPSGQFGTRILGGKDAASPRYVFTRLENITRAIFHPNDDAILDYLQEDGQKIEPSYYMPVLPLVLVNGSDGIGTGWSTFIPNFNPRDIISNLKLLIAGEDMVQMDPWYRGFTGTITQKTGKPKDGLSYLVRGAIEVINDTTVHISELPARKWTQDYKAFLESLLAGGSGTKDPNGDIKDFRENHTDTMVSFTVTFTPEQAAKMDMSENALVKKFKLETSLSLNNMHLFNAEGAMRKYTEPNSIVEEFYGLRLSKYAARKKHMLKVLERDWTKLSNKVRFILAVCSGELVVSNKAKAKLLVELQEAGYDMIIPLKEKETKDDEDEDEDEDDASSTSLSKGYDYLMSMKIWSLTLEKVEALRKDLGEKETELNALKLQSPSDLWLEDLVALEELLETFEDDHNALQTDVPKGKKNKAPSKRKPKKKAAPKKHIMEMDSDEDDFDEMDEDDDSDFDEAPKKKKAPVKKAAPKPKAAAKAAPKAAPAAKPKAAAKKPKAAPRKVVEVASEDEDEGDIQVLDVSEDEEVLSLADRIASRMKVTPKKEDAKPKAKPAAKRKLQPKKKQMVLLSDSEDEEEFDSAGDDDSESEFEEEAPAPKAAAAKKPAAKKPARKPAAKKMVISDSEDDEAEFDDGEDDDSDFGESPKPKAAKKPAAKKPVAKKAAKKAPAAKAVAKPAAKPAPKKTKTTKTKAAVEGSGITPMKPAAKKSRSKQIESESDSEVETDSDAGEDDNSPVARRTPKPSRARGNPVSYAVDSDESDSDMEEPDSPEQDDESDYSD